MACTDDTYGKKNTVIHLIRELDAMVEIGAMFEGAKPRAISPWWRVDRPTTLVEGPTSFSPWPPKEGMEGAAVLIYKNGEQNIQVTSAAFERLRR